MENNNKKLWFKAKTYGWGWTPTGWQGWTVVFAYIVILSGLFFYFAGKSNSDIDTLKNFAIAYVPATSLLFYICVKKGEKPKWKWGDKGKQKE